MIKKEMIAMLFAVWTGGSRLGVLTAKGSKTGSFVWRNIEL